jgi:hypothetical protein
VRLTVNCCRSKSEIVTLVLDTANEFWFHFSVNHRSRILSMTLLCLFVSMIHSHATSDSGTSTQSIADDQSQDFTAEHESNGPEGEGEIPMQQMPSKGIAFAVIVLAGSAGLILSAKKKDLVGKPETNG